MTDCLKQPLSIHCSHSWGLDSLARMIHGRLSTGALAALYSAALHRASAMRRLGTFRRNDR